MRKFLSLLALLVLPVALAACGAKTDDTTATPEAMEAPAVEATETPAMEATEAAPVVPAAMTAPVMEAPAAMEAPAVSVPVAPVTAQ